MPPEVASSSSYAVSIAAWLGCAAFVVGLVNGVLALVDRLKERPSPSETYVRLADFSEHRRLVLDRIESQRVALEAARDAEREELAGLRNEIRGDIRRIHDRVDDLPAQIIATLRNTGAIQ